MNPKNKKNLLNLFDDLSGFINYFTPHFKDIFYK